jgi:CubicO group peptidase (beta-lactamase class C family)
MIRTFLPLLLIPGLASASDTYSRIQSISGQVQESMKKYDVPGVSVAVFENYRVVWTKGYGVADVNTKKPVDASTLFQAASISKPVAALAVMRLVQDGFLDLDANVNTYLKSWKLPENDLTRATPVTLRMIMSHTAGITVHGFKGYEAGSTIPTVPQVLDGVAPANSEAVRVTVAPKTKFDYSGGGYTILQQLLVDVAHHSFPELMRSLVLDPVGMALSTYEQPLPASAVPIASTAHEPHGQAIKGERHIYPEMAAAGLSTTPSELARFAIAIQNARNGQPGSVIPKALAQAMTSPFIPGSFGLGFEMLRSNEKEKRFFGHTGGNVGYRCMLLASLEGGNGVVVMTNGDEFKAVAEIVNKTVAEYGW